jgi:hypothetical protein
MNMRTPCIYSPVGGVTARRYQSRVGVRREQLSVPNYGAQQLKFSKPVRRRRKQRTQKQVCLGQVVSAVGTVPVFPPGAGRGVVYIRPRNLPAAHSMAAAHLCQACQQIPVALKQQIGTTGTAETTPVWETALRMTCKAID